MIEAQKILVVEDERSTRNFLIRHLSKIGAVTKSASNLYDAKEEIEEFNPNIILLDLNIPNKENELPDISNAFEVLEKVQLYNKIHLNKIKVIVISGTIFDNAIKKIISLSDKVIFKYIDKSGIAEDSTKFNIELKNTLKDLLNEEEDDICLDYEFIREDKLKELKTVDLNLWNKINKELILKFKKLYSKGSDENSDVQKIIISIGTVIEDIIIGIKTSSLTDIQKVRLKNENSTQRKLEILSGRLKDRGKFTQLGKEIIKRKSVKYAQLVYEIRNEIVHGDADLDLNNKKLFNNTGASAEDAAIAMNLIVPLIIDYTKYKTSKTKEDKGSQSSSYGMR